MKKTSWGVILSLVLAFAAGAAAGIFADRFLLSPRGHRHSGPSPDQWEKDLGLTEDQKARIHAIFEKNDGRVDGLRADFYKHVEEIRSEIRKEIDAVLTPEQKAKQDALMEKIRESRSKTAGSRPSGTEGRPEGGAAKENRDEKKEASGGSGDSGRDRGPGHRRFLY